MNIKVFLKSITVGIVIFCYSFVFDTYIQVEKNFLFYLIVFISIVLFTFIVDKLYDYFNE